MTTTWTELATGPLEDHEVALRAVPAALLARRLEMCGFTPIEAANIVARLAGLPAAKTGWTVRQVEHLVFLRTIVENGRLTA